MKLVFSRLKKGGGGRHWERGQGRPEGGVRGRKEVGSRDVGEKVERRREA